MISAHEAYEAAKVMTKKSETWKYLTERINWSMSMGNVQMFVSFDHNPQTAIHMMRELGYTVTPHKIDQEAHYYSFIISWFPLDLE